MERIVGNTRYVGKRGGGYELTKRDLGNGHLEYGVRSLVTWEDHGDLTPEAMAYYHEARAANEEERKENSRRIAAIRAKKRVRHLCKAAGLDTLLTLTYRANVTCRDTMLAHLKEFNRRMKRLIPDWFYVAAFERQKRGAWHVHMAIRRLPNKLPSQTDVKVKNVNVVRAVWRRVIGDLGGNIDYSPAKRNSQRAPSRIASYLSKYMVKAFEEGEPWSKRYSGSKGLPIPKPERIRFVGYDLGEVCGLIFEDLGTYDTRQLRCSLNYFKDGAWFILDRNIPPWTDAQWAAWADHHPESWLEAA